MPLSASTQKQRQVVGPLGVLVDRMIRRSVKRNFRAVWWVPPMELPSKVTIFVPNHHGWYDGYLMYHALTSLNVVSVDWIAEFDAFPLFKFVGGMPFPASNPSVRASTIRATIRKMRREQTSLLLFAEGILHRPPEILPFGKSLELLCRQVPEAMVVPVAIRYEMALHERPEAFILFGAPMVGGSTKPEAVRLAVKDLLDLNAKKIAFDKDGFQLLAKGTLDVNERLDMRKLPWGRFR